ncbi:MAG TPA: hypothetical protein VD866_12660 [Urbifossiella sp.]|nr:hypothetical protein [Urbifossiella sp.]
MNPNDLDLLKLLTTDGATLTLSEARQETGRNAPPQVVPSEPRFTPGIETKLHETPHF